MKMENADNYYEEIDTRLVFHVSMKMKTIVLISIVK